MARKLSKQDVSYRPSTGSRRCGNCIMFRQPHSCTLVKGFIKRSDVCNRWAAK